MTRARYPVLTTVLSVPATVMMLVAGAAHAQTISKCQDAEGNWHYGDFAAEACAEEATITEIDERGLKIKESDAPPTAEELEAQKAEEERQRREDERIAREAAEDRRLLQTYDSAQAIVNARDQRLGALDQELESHRLFRQDLVNERQKAQTAGDGGKVADLDQQIEQYDAAIRRLEEQQMEITEQYSRELERYRELTE